MRILHVVETLSARYGGPAVVAAKLCVSLDRAGHQTTIFATDRDYPSGPLLAPVDEARDGKLNVEYFPVEVEALCWSNAMARALSARIAGFDMVHIHGFYRFPQIAAAYYARRHGIPYVVQPHDGLDPGTFKRAERRVVRAVYLKMFGRPQLQQAAALISNSEAERAVAEPFGLTAPTLVVPNGIDTAEFESLPPRGAFRARHNLGQRPIVLFYGRLTAKKGLDLAVAAFASHLKTYPDSVFVIAGPDNEAFKPNVDRWIAEAGIGDKVIFTGMLTGDERWQVLRDADMFILPSYSEGFSIAVAEAMACRLPVLISNRVKIADLVRAAGAGPVTDCDVGEVTAAMNALMADPDGRSRMGAAGRSVILNEFGWTKVAADFAQAYKTIVATARQGSSQIERHVAPLPAVAGGVRPRRILYCHNNYTTRGGETDTFETEIKGLRAAGHDVMIYERQSLEFEVGSVVARMGYAASMPWSPRTVRDLEALVGSFKPEVAIVQNVFPLITPAAFAVLKRVGVPVIYACYNYRLVCPSAYLFTEGAICERCVTGHSFHAVSHRCIKDSAAISLAYATTLDLHRRLGTFERNIDRIIIPDRFMGEKLAAGGISRDKFRTLANPFLVHDYTPLPEHEGYLLFVGRISRQKGVMTLAAAMAGTAPGVRLIIVGDGPQEAELRAVIAASPAADRIDFRGPVWGQVVVDLMARAKGIVVPSEWYDNLPVVVCQANALGRPVIASRINGIPEYVEDGRNGLLFPPGNSTALAAAMDHVHQMPPGEWRTFAARSRAYAEAELDYPAHLRGLMEVIEELAPAAAARAA